ncbi:hypothetical protein NCAST_23_01380 [Nocardia asteroides NBRC 15531]|uniref:Uncharacterized protein n=1 Tax=Nocardia asteroides NBRC 15531 TaxID=1110697 RepID=U5EAJ1_NOCAS|nr:hypothetical protein NCAST_23_01380 [Nocardia asteroides NBRC 15531]
MAELESLVTYVIRSVNGVINDRAHVVSDIKPCLRSIACHSVFDSLRTVADSQKVWSSRQLVTTLESSTDILELPVTYGTAQPPLDGRTLTPGHFIRIWSIYGLDGTWYPTISCAMTLTKLSGARNDLAHGNEPFNIIFSQPGLDVKSIERYMDEMCMLYIHFSNSFVDYIENSRYI